MIKNYKATFFKVEKELDDKGNVLGKKYSCLGSVTLDDSNVNNTDLTLVSKAYRHANSSFLATADRVKIEEIK